MGQLQLRRSYASITFLMFGWPSSQEVDREANRHAPAPPRPHSPGLSQVSVTVVPRVCVCVCVYFLLFF